MCDFNAKMDVYSILNQIMYTLMNQYKATVVIVSSNSRFQALNDTTTEVRDHFLDP